MLDEKYTKSLLIFLLDSGEASRKSQLSMVVSNPYKLTERREKLSKEGLIKYDINQFGKKSI